jgi:tetratricopeptide (TPR) repeat protein
MSNPHSEFVSSQGKSIESYLQDALQAQSEKKYPKVLVLCQTIFQQSPDLLAARRLSAIAHLNLQSYQAALDDWNIYIPQRPEDSSAYGYRGICYQHLNRSTEALTDFEQAVSLQPQNPVFIHARGRVHYCRGELTLALADYDAAIELQPSRAEVYTDRAEIKFSQNELKTALLDCSLALKIDPKSIDAYRLRSSIYVELGDLHAAIADCHRWVDLDPLQVRAYTQRSWIYFRQGQYPTAIEECERILNLDPNHVRGHYLLGVLRSLSGLKREAVFNFTKAIALAPQESASRFNRGILYYDLQEPSKGKQDFDLALKLDGIAAPTEETGLYAKGLALFYLDFPDLACDTFHQAAKIAAKYHNTTFQQQIDLTISALGLG